MHLGLFAVALIAVGQTDPSVVDINCGAYCAYLAARAMGVEVGEFPQFHLRLGPAERGRGYSMATLSDTLEKLGLRTLAVKTDLSTLERIKTPFACIARYHQGHFVTPYKFEAKRVSVIDPPDDYPLRRSLFEAQWTGEVLLVSREPIELPPPLPPPAPWWHAWVVGSGIGIVLMGVALAVRGWLLRRHSS